MANHTTYSSEELASAISISPTWRQVAIALKKSPKTPAERLRSQALRLGIDYSHLEGRVGGKSTSNLAPPAILNPKNEDQSGVAEASAISWFVSQGAEVSLPISPTTYDLVVDWGTGLQKVQVKSSSSLRRGRSYQVKLVKTKYSPSKDGEKWQHRQVCYEEGDVDWFFVHTSDGASYLIPFQSTTGQTSLNVPGVYEKYRLLP